MIALIIFFVIVSFALWFVYSVTEYKQNPQVKIICKNNILYYIEDDYQRDIWVGNRFQINCKQSNNTILITGGITK